MAKSVSKKGSTPVKKKAAPKKSASKATPAKKIARKRSPLKKSAIKKTVKKKAAPKKTASKASPAKKVARKRSPLKKSAVKKAAIKKGLGMLPEALELAASTTGTADFRFEFFGGGGNARVTLFRNGTRVDVKSVQDDGTLHFNDVRSNDTASVRGVCTGTGRLTINVDTNPDTPTDLSTGQIIKGYTIL